MGARVYSVGARVYSSLVILVSPPVPIGLGFFTSLGLGLGLGGQGLGLGFDNWIVLLRLTSKLVIMFDRHTKQADKRGQINQNNEFMSHNSMATPVQCMRMEIKQTSEYIVQS